MKKGKILTSLQEEINSDRVKESYRVNLSNFTRQRILGFRDLVYMRLNLMNKSISVEVNKYLGQFAQQQVSKQAFSKAIQKIKWEGFEHFNNFFVKDFYESGDYKKYKNKYLLAATDGTTFELPYVEALVDLPIAIGIGQFDNGQMSHPLCMAMSVKVYDVLNDMTICSSLSPYYINQTKGNSEQALFEDRLEDMKELIQVDQHEVLLIGDKYYPSFYYFETLPEQGFNFVFRCTANFCKEVKAFAQSGDKQAYLTIDLNKSHRKYSTSAQRLDKQIDQVKVRCIRIDLPNQQAMFLLTNLSEQDLSIEELGEIYNLRWGEETSFNIDKNVLEMENFSSKSVNGVLQEFFAKTLTANITSLIVNEAQEQLDQEQKNKINKYQYKINRKVAIGLIKDEIVPFLNASEKAEVWTKRMVKLVLPHRSAIRPNRAFPKKRKHKLKFSMNLRRAT